MFLHGIWYSRAEKQWGSVREQYGQQAEVREGSCAINRNSVKIWSATALAVVCIGLKCACMWEECERRKWRAWRVCVSIRWVSGLCELNAGMNQDRHLCPRPSMACLISFINEAYSLLLCLSVRVCVWVSECECEWDCECIHVCAHQPPICISSLWHECVCVHVVVPSYEVSVRYLKLSCGECLHILHESSRTAQYTHILSHTQAYKTGMEAKLTICLQLHTQTLIYTYDIHTGLVTGCFSALRCCTGTTVSTAFPSISCLPPEIQSFFHIHPPTTTIFYVMSWLHLNRPKADTAHTWL